MFYDVVIIGGGIVGYVIHHNANGACAAVHTALNEFADANQQGQPDDNWDEDLD